MKPIYDIQLSSADGEPNFLDQFKGKVTLLTNTTVGCGNANQMEVLQMLQDKYGGDDFQIIAIPTNDYCGPGITHGKWSEGITCGADSANYGKDVYGTTFQFSEMVSSNPNGSASEIPGKNGLGQDRKPPHELYEVIAGSMHELKEKQKELNIEDNKDYYSYWLNMGTTNGAQQGGNFEKYLIDRDGYVMKHFTCTVLNYDIEKTLKEFMISQGQKPMMGEDRSTEIFEEEFNFVCSEIEKAIAGAKSVLNPALVNA